MSTSKLKATFQYKNSPSWLIKLPTTRFLKYLQPKSEVTPGLLVTAQGRMTNHDITNDSATLFQQHY